MDIRRSPSSFQSAVCEAPRPQGGASRARSGEQNVSKRNFILMVPLDPAYPALAGRGTCRSPVTRKSALLRIAKTRTGTSFSAIRPEKPLMSPGRGRCEAHPFQIRVSISVSDCKEA